ncbi:MAG TPA: S8 family serine peptidase [Blastocatellia bacterium]|nr:S8 family serine peptidase [Blastocatellia bacterium]
MGSVNCGSRTDNEYTNLFGRTSGAAAKVAGVIALMLEANRKLTIDDIRVILSAGTPVASDADKPVGAFLDAEAAVCEALRRKGKKC